MIQKIALGVAFVALGLGIFNIVSSKEAHEVTNEMEALQSDEVTINDENHIPRIGFVRGDSLNLQYKFILDKEDELISYSRVSENKLGRQLKAAEKEYTELVQYVQSGSATESDMAVAQQRLMQLEQELQSAQQGEQENLARKEAVFQQEIADRLSEFLERYAKENEIDLILNWGFSREGVLYGQAPFDITKGVVNQLNMEYALEMAPQTEEK
ncbi:MAG: Skp family chaperone for outer membrane protein [Flavobacteriales bacterium]|jgi:Skp family chaperone for outer membrane proteins